MRQMVFVDGTNWLAQLGMVCGKPIRTDKPSQQVIKIACEIVKAFTASLGEGLVRRFWFGSCEADEEYRLELSEWLRAFGFEPVIFPRRDPKREKGVDIALTSEMLINAFNDNYDRAHLVAGDEDYVQLVNEVKRFGAIVHGCFVEAGLARRLRLACDRFTVLKMPDTQLDEMLQRLSTALGTGA